ncbi:MAG: ATP-binding protein [Oscillospiraceae bacterium]|nr:ATP-binding protein [Oscillospiraceae bacterium]MBO5640338.1 ATP-binding protein [Oscillospiraceae bacterium]
MRRKIFVNTFMLGALILIFCAALFFALQYSQTLDETYAALKGEAVYAASGLKTGGQEYLESLENINRITWIAADGTVLYDSEFADHSGNQSDYAEVKAALEKGEGQGVRDSTSMGESTMYYAFLCDDGTVLRLSRPLSAVRYALLAVSPVLWVLLLVLIVSGIMAFKVAQMVLKPINELDLDDLDPAKTYPELAPLVTRIQEQKKAIREEIERRENLRKEFSANVSHELKTPLTSISGFAELMRDGLVPADKVKEFAGDIYRESQRMITRVDDIMRLSKLDEEKGFPEAEDMDLYDVAADVLANLEPQAEKRNIALTLVGSHAVIQGGFPVVQEMLFNLVDNAIKYNRDGGSVTVRVKEADGKASVSVTDTGIGIPTDEQDRVFERFYRVDKSHSKQIGGTGLGLSIVKHGAQLHGAKVMLDSEPGKGTTATIVFCPQKNL